ncbi:MAG: DUF302 domain-containing protein [Gammaproteobacteria bacterium]|jgi:uncharacterized protein (DUF302 family)
MSFIRNLLALVGLIAIIGGGYMYTKLKPEFDALNSLDPGARDVYLTMWHKLKETGSSADATVVRYQVDADLSWEEVEDSMKSVANSHNIKAVGELPLSEQVELMTGEEQPFLKIYQFCNPLTAMKMIGHSEAFSAYLPCRISLLEDKEGKLWLYSLDMDMMIRGGRTLPEELLVDALKVQEIITDIMVKGAAGDF